MTAAAFSPLFASRLHEQDNMAPAGAAPEAECVTVLTRAGRTGTPLAAIFAKGRRAERRGPLQRWASGDAALPPSLVRAARNFLPLGALHGSRGGGRALLRAAA